MVRIGRLIEYGMAYNITVCIVYELKDGQYFNKDPI
jgi:hypothetical protein